MTDERTLYTARTWPHSFAEIYSAFASPDLLALWWGPEGFSSTFQIFEFEVGGRWEFTLHGPNGHNYPNTSVFLELIPNAKVVIQHNCPQHFILTIELVPIEGGTLLKWEQTFEDVKTAQPGIFIYRQNIYSFLTATCTWSSWHANIKRFQPVHLGDD